MDKVVVLLSGGIDSSTLMYSLYRDFECYPISILYAFTDRDTLAPAQQGIK
jgi:7-cyano-7-deazaguanine synthase in queuosine biosynthesis